MGLGALFSPLRQLTIVTDHTMNVVGQLMLISDVFDAACMDFVANTFFRSKMAIEFELTLMFPMLDCKIVTAITFQIGSYKISNVFSDILHDMMYTANLFTAKIAGFHCVHFSTALSLYFWHSVNACSG